MYLIVLPTEILVQIFSELDYATLKLAMQLVCRRFREIISDDSTAQLADALFRGRPRKLHGLSVADEKDPPKYQLHPCFSNIRLRNPSSTSRDIEIDERTIYSYLQKPEFFGFYTASGEFLPIMQTSLVDENATSPATDILVFKDPETAKGGWGEIFPVRIDHRDTGDPVTVAEVLKSQSDCIQTHVYSFLSYGYTNAGWVFPDGKLFPDPAGDNPEGRNDAYEVRLLTEGEGKGMVLSKLAHVVSSKERLARRRGKY